MKNPHLEKLRRAKRMRTGGMPFAKIAEALGVTDPTARAWVKEAHLKQKLGTLFVDMDSDANMDMYNRMSIERRS